MAAQSLRKTGDHNKGMRNCRKIPSLFLEMQSWEETGYAEGGRDFHTFSSEASLLTGRRAQQGRS
jgi:hypothetical protein